MKKRLFLLFAFTLVLLLWIPSAFAAKSGDLFLRRTDTTDGYITDYVDANGVITIATDKGYATVRRVIENGKTVEEYYFDELGAPIKVSGAYGRINLYDAGQCTQITYVDADRKPMLNSSGYASIKHLVDEKGRVLQEMYFDTARKPVMLSGGQGGLRREMFDDANRVTQFTYLDTNGEPVILTTGYSTIKRTYDEFGRAETDMYFDLAGKPVKHSSGYYGMWYIRDDGGKHIGSTYLDQDGQPMACSSGYVTVMYEYDDWNNIVQYSYCDADGKPTELSRGQYGQRHVYERKELIRSYYVDAQGKEMFLLDQYLHQNLWLNVVAAVVLTVCAVFLPRKLRWGILLLYVLFILYMTLIVREAGEQENKFELFWSYKSLFTKGELSVQVVQNILLFVPFGAFVCSLLGEKMAILSAIALSMLIESAQLVFHLGWCELDDVINNGLGGCIGAVALWCLMWIPGLKRNLKQK